MIFRTARHLCWSPLSSPEAKESMLIFWRCLFFPVVNSGPTSVCYSTCIYFSRIIAAGPGSDKLRWWGKGSLVSVECASLRSREGMPKPAQHQPRLQVRCWGFVILHMVNHLRACKVGPLSSSSWVYTVFPDCLFWPRAKATSFFHYAC